MGSKVENFDDIPIKSSQINFLELLEKNLAEQSELYGDGSNNSSKIQTNSNSEKHKSLQARKNHRFKKEITVSQPSKDTKKYKYYSDNFDESEINSNKNNQNNQSEKVSLNNYKIEKVQITPIHPKSIEKNILNFNNITKQKENKLKIPNEEKEKNNCLNPYGSTNFPNNKPKTSYGNSRKNAKSSVNPLT